MKKIFIFTTILLLLFMFDLSHNYRVLSNTDPSFECTPCARTRLIGCYHGKCTYRCYRSCNNGTFSFIEAQKFVIVGTK
ncbi:unnamed protein product [Oppiella nova]|uniref:Uncharacterized protein n=1 Tax=Oppiella nova TaxID=334625 RepID=A0A7R9QPY4_9ACAR|nr:unnamed protein product [Oppiella nova]CAD7659832.1 unnamed protein product [Oppiella nova]CAG2171165.1 unnamed protein product [Oppiella nova]CAG2176970.1 unnamed protein product [Oppiella nova]